MIEEMTTALGVCVTAAILATLLKQHCKEQALFCALGCCVVVGLAVVSGLSEVLETLSELFSQTGLPVIYLELVWKAVGVCYLTSVAADLCRDCGESALASVAELCGRIALVLLSLPLLEGVLETIANIL